MDSSSPQEFPRPVPNPGLPPVQPPSGRFIIQLFVIPGILILTVVLLVLGLSYLRKREREPFFFLQQLDSNNGDIRWRGASDLAQILKRPEPATLRWKADPRFALDLAERLDAAFKDLLEQEKSIAFEVGQRTDKDKHLLWRKLRNHRDTISFLASALGEFHAPVGAPVVCAILKHNTSADLGGNSLQRRKALWALMNMGENLKGFAAMPAEQKNNALAVLKEESQGVLPRAGWARTALYYLDEKALPETSRADIVKVDETLFDCARDDDRFLRELVAMAFNFWDSDRAEVALQTLTEDTGWGTLIRVEEDD